MTPADDRKENQIKDLQELIDRLDHAIEKAEQVKRTLTGAAFRQERDRVDQFKHERMNYAVQLKQLKGE